MGGRVFGWGRGVIQGHGLLRVWVREGGSTFHQQPLNHAGEVLWS
jgi:hypothetical protein